MTLRLPQIRPPLFSQRLETVLEASRPIHVAEIFPLPKKMRDEEESKHCIHSIPEIGTRPTVGLQGCFDGAGADFGFGRGVRDLATTPESQRIKPSLRTWYIHQRPLYSLFVHSLSLSLTLPLCPRPSGDEDRFRRSPLPLASCLPDTLASTNKHPQGLPEYFIYSATSFLFFGSILVSRARLFSRASFFSGSSSSSMLLGSRLRYPFSSFFWIIFSNGFFFAARFYRPDSLSMRSTSRFYLLDLSSSIPMFYLLDASEDMEGTSFLRFSGEGDSVPLFF